MTVQEQRSLKASCREASKALRGCPVGLTLTGSTSRSYKAQAFDRGQMRAWREALGADENRTPDYVQL